MGLQVLLEGNQEGSRRRNFEGGGWERWKGVGGRGEINTAGTTYGFIVTDVNLGKYPNAPLAYAPGLELHQPIISKLGYS